MKEKENSNNINHSRRNFLKKAGYYGAGLFSFPLLGNNINLFPITQTISSSTVSIVKGQPGEKITRKAIELLGGMNKFINRGDIVVIKPNMAFNTRPKLAANTNPGVVGEIIQLCYSSGAKKVKVTDTPGSILFAETLFKTSGIEAVCKKYDAELVYPKEERFKTINLKGKVIKEWPVNLDILECDKLINVPVAKHHQVAKLTAGMKNFYGAILGNRWDLHDNIDQSILDLSRFFKPNLIVIDGIKTIFRYGPQGRGLSDIKINDTVIAGTDCVSCDAMAATLLGYNPEEIGYISLAGKEGLGTSSLSKIKRLTFQY